MPFRISGLFRMKKDIPYDPSDITQRKGVTYKGKEAIECVFCDITQEKIPNGSRLWFKDDRVAVFIPRTPAAFLHFLVVPLDHIKSTKYLNESHVPLLSHMEKVALNMVAANLDRPVPISPKDDVPQPPAILKDILMEELEKSEILLDYHCPPFNSIDHLHMHALVTPFNSIGDFMQFLPWAPWTQSHEDVVDMAASKAAEANSNELK